MFIVFGFHDGDRDTGLLVENIIGELFLFLVAGGHVAPDNDGAWRKGDFTPDLPHLIPSRRFDGGCDKAIADVGFAELLFVNLIQNEPRSQCQGRCGSHIKILIIQM